MIAFRLITLNSFIHSSIHPSVSLARNNQSGGWLSCGMAEKESEDQYDILDLCMHMFSGSKDDDGTEQVPPLPLSFD